MRLVDRVTARIWTGLCVATAISALASFLWPLQGLLLVAALVPGMLVMLIVGVAGYADWARRCGYA